MKITGPTIYTASKAKHGPKWLALRQQGWPIISMWIDVWEDGTITDWELYWVRCIEEAATADYCLAYCEDEDVLKGANCEIGAALAQGCQVIFVGDPEIKRYTVARHPLVTVVSTLQEALDFIRQREMAQAFHFSNLRDVS